MFSHGPSCLKGPLSHLRCWWNRWDTGDLETSTEFSLPTPDPLQREGPIRQQLVDRIRAEIAAGAYETQERWEAALSRLLRRLEAE